MNAVPKTPRRSALDVDHRAKQDPAYKYNRVTSAHKRSISTTLCLLDGFKTGEIETKSKPSLLHSQNPRAVKNHCI